MPGLSSPILQVDGEDNQKKERTVKFTFVSDYGEEDILYSLETQFPAKLCPTLVSRERKTRLGADHFCVVEIKLDRNSENFSWPNMIPSEAEVFKEVKRIKQ